MSDININFLVSLPRAGNTILSSVLNQNPYVKVSANSVVPLLIDSINNIKLEERFLNFPDSTGLDNTLNNVFKNYYEHYKCKNIIDRGAWGHYWKIIERLPLQSKKYIILYRPILEVLASFVKVHKPRYVEEYCDDMMMKDSIITENLNSIRNILVSKKDYLLITYDELIKDFSKTIQKICKYINAPFKKPDFKNIQQFNINNVYYNDSAIRHRKGIFHTIDTKSIKRKECDIKKILPEYTINKYKGFDVI